MHSQYMRNLYVLNHSKFPRAMPEAYLSHIPGTKLLKQSWEMWNEWGKKCLNESMNIRTNRDIPGGEGLQKPLRVNLKAEGMITQRGANIRYFLDIWAFRGILRTRSNLYLVRNLISRLEYSQGSSDSLWWLQNAFLEGMESQESFWVMGRDCWPLET